MFDRRLKGAKYFFVATVTVEIDDGVGHRGNQVLQDFALHRREIKEAIQHQKFNVVEPGQGNSSTINLTSQNLQRPQNKMTERVVITGLGALSGLGAGALLQFEKARAGVSAEGTPPRTRT